jgi:hypothetical protein
MFPKIGRKYNPAIDFALLKGGAKFCGVSFEKFVPCYITNYRLAAPGFAYGMIYKC